MIYLFIYLYSYLYLCVCMCMHSACVEVRGQPEGHTGSLLFSTMWVPGLKSGCSFILLFAHRYDFQYFFILLCGCSFYLELLSPPWKGFLISWHASVLFHLHFWSRFLMGMYSRLANFYFFSYHFNNLMPSISFFFL